MATLNLPPLTSPRYHALHPDTGRPVSGGTIRFYINRTTTPKAVFADREGQHAAPNPYTLDAAGGADVYLSGIYTIAVYDANGTLLFTKDQVNSVPVELPTGNPGSLLIANNLSDVADPAAARAALALEKQSSQSDTIAGRLLTVGAFGLGGNPPTVTALNALNTTTGLVNGRVRVFSANVATVGGPPGGPGGVVDTVKWGADNILQIYYPATGQSAQPWRRIFFNGGWTLWRRDFETDTGVNGRWRRFGDGTQICTHSLNLGDRTAIGAGTYDNPYRTELGVWTFPNTFFAGNVPSISVTPFVETTEVGVRALSVSFRAVSTTQVTGIVATAINSNATSIDVNVSLTAIGRYY